MSCRNAAILFIVLSAFDFAPVQQAVSASTQVVFRTSLGDFRANLLDDVAPLTVANFLKYVDEGDYENTIVHRTVSNFVIQGGGHTTTFQPIPNDPPINNEFLRPNVRATLAMAKPGNNPNGATSQWFINLVNNSSFLDTQNGGFTVFGEILPGDMAIVDAIAALPRVNANIPSSSGPFSELPVLEFPVGITNRNDLKLVVVSDIDRVPEPSTLFCVSIAAGVPLVCGRRKRRRD
jgi:cyclophilin family peptidyl-prolyl cis-trans isomerase